MLAQEESRLLDHDYVGTEHVLLGLLREGEGVAARALDALAVSHDAVRAAVQASSGEGPGSPDGHPFTPRAKKSLELALREALELGHNYIGTEHLLLGIVREGESMAMRILLDLHVDGPAVRAKVMELLRGYESPSTPRLSPVGGPTCPGCGTRLEGRLGAKAMAATSDDGDGVVAMTMIYCRGCGRGLGAFPGASPPI